MVDLAGVAGVGAAWPPAGDGRRELSSPASALEPPYKKLRNSNVQAYPNQEEGGFPPHAPSDLNYGDLCYGSPSLNPSQGTTTYGGQQQMQVPSNGYSQPTSQASTVGLITPFSGFPPGSAKSTGALFLKTKLCTKFKLGTCTFDDRCHFAHGVEDLRKPPAGWETMVENAGQGGPLGGRSNDGLQQRKKSSKPCRFFADGKECPYGGRCTFSHIPGDNAYPASGFGNSESGGMPASGARFKTRMCAKWERGEPCNYGDRCHYAHGYAELQSSTGISAYNSAAGVNEPYQSLDSEMASFPTQFPNSNNMTAAPATGSHGGPFSVSNANTHSNPYSAAPNGTQDSFHDYPKPQSYWNGPIPQGGYVAPPQAGYVQVNQAAGGWVGNHFGEGGYPRDPSSAAQYIPPLIQQQPGVQPYASGVTGPVYQESKQPTDVQPYVSGSAGPVYQESAPQPGAQPYVSGSAGPVYQESAQQPGAQLYVSGSAGPVYQESAQQPGAQLYASGSAGMYHAPKQMTSLPIPYVQGGSRSNYQAEAMAGKGGYYSATY